MSEGGFVATESFWVPRANKGRYGIDNRQLTIRVPASTLAFLAFGLNDGTAGVSSVFEAANCLGTHSIRIPFKD